MEIQEKKNIYVGVQTTQTRDIRDFMMEINLYKNILVFAEVGEDKVCENSLELLGEANRLKNIRNNDSFVIAALVGHNVKKYAPTLFGYGADKVVAFDSPMLEVYRSDLYGEALAGIVRAYHPEIVLVGATALGSELAPTVAAKLRTGLAAHCTALKILDNGQFTQVVPAFGGKVLGDIYIPNHRPQIASIKAGITKKLDYAPKDGIVEDFSCELKGFDRMKVTKVEKETETCKSLNEADCIVVGGFGIGSKEEWSKLEELASLLGGANGCTRPVLDAGWVSNEKAMIGTSGVAVRPKAYLGIGVSGAAHHTCGIKDSGLIISINKDENAPIFACSDYKVVADYKKIVPALIEELKARKG